MAIGKLKFMLTGLLPNFSEHSPLHSVSISFDPRYTSHGGWLAFGIVRLVHIDRTFHNFS